MIRENLSECCNVGLLCFDCIDIIIQISYWGYMNTSCNKTLSFGPMSTITHSGNKIQALKKTVLWPTILQFSTHATFHKLFM